MGIAVLVWLSLLVPRQLGLWQFLELAAFDALLAARHGDAPLSRRLGVVGITEADVRRFGHPLPDRVLTAVLETLLAHGVRLVGVDLYRDLPVPPGHAALQALLEREPRIYWIFGFGTAGREAVAPPSALVDSARVGFNDLPLDPDGVVRRGLLYQDDGSQVVGAFALQMALGLLREQGISPRPWSEDATVLQLGESPLPPLTGNLGGYRDLPVGGYQFLLDYRGRGDRFPVIGVGELLDHPPDDWIRDRVVLIGTLARSVNDSVLTPFAAAGSDDPQLRGVLLQGLILDQLLRLAAGQARLMGGWSESWEIAWIGLWSLMGAWLALGAASFLRTLLGAVGGLVVLLGAAYGLFLGDLWVPLLPPAVAWVSAVGLTTAYLATLEKAQRGRLMQLFARHVSPEVATLIWDQRDALLSGGRLLPRRVTATVLFTDLVGFTAIAEKSDPPALMDWLNLYMATMSREIFSRQGVIDKYIGDAIMAVFGVPLARDDAAAIQDDAIHAVGAALAMDAALAGLNRQWAAAGLPRVGMRIGIHTGMLVAGTLGGAEHVEYTVIGDTVNTASRLESFDKSLLAPPGMVTRILITEATRRQVGEHFRVESVGEVALKGKDQSVTVFRVLGRRSPAAPDNVSL